MRAVAFEELLQILLVVHDWVLFNLFDFNDSISSIHGSVELDSELFDLLSGQSHILLYNVNVKVGREVMHVRAH